MVSAYTISGVNPRDVMTAFAQYGFRKTSMEDIARAVGLSRQSIYKKFGSKDACYSWSLVTYMQALYQNVFGILDEAKGDPIDVLATVLTSVVGDSVELAKTRHGAELLEDALKLSADQPENWPKVYVENLARFMSENGLAATPDRALDLAHLLVTSTRGALVVSTSRDEFSDDIHRILRTVFSDT
ncbi:MULTISPECIES: TetR/AcrR family transcriptional regulator [unclassified Ruegeria]|uniref:TetR/AcrR family transcriptional regulator n=1 Tax=unclassified Ruegeria TaxID=2625375 RepID=UPI001ADA01C7|nr:MULTISPECIES: TetR/AcrR family transcriptional regulator [unclassified Ruegeria]MBO9410930.1 TetR/AcrR family transcriptional regulator [Ruegeria sp. R8_1]MBO9415131.1 TetR/AcrR family transcriptional regulator [Ruegeria sp. R8_2]